MHITDRCDPDVILYEDDQIASRGFCGLALADEPLMLISADVPGNLVNAPLGVDGHRRDRRVIPERQFTPNDANAVLRKISMFDVMLAGLLARVFLNLHQNGTCSSIPGATSRLVKSDVVAGSCSRLMSPMQSSLMI